MKTQLTVEQSAKLIELGVSPERASETRMDFNGTYAYVQGEESQTVRDCVNGHFYVEECRIFTLADILDILPRMVKGEKFNIEAWDEIWCAAYDEYTFYACSELIDALHLLLVWCLEKGYVKTDMI